MTLKIADTVNLYSQAKIRTYRADKQRLSTQRHGDMQIISQPKRAIPETEIYPFLISNYHSLTTQFDTRFPDKIGYMYPKSICNI